MRLLFVVLFVASALALTGCKADQEVKQGSALEVCNGRDSDCRPGHTCFAGVCRETAIADFDCPSMCERIRRCGARDESCVGDCELTLAGVCDEAFPCPWSDEAVIGFGQCVIQDLTCEDILSGDAPTLCYQSLDLPQERAQRCDAIIESMDSCEVDSETRAEVFQGCYQLARTTTEESFERILPCEEAASLEGECEVLLECVASIFEI